MEPGRIRLPFFEKEKPKNEKPERETRANPVSLDPRTPSQRRSPFSIPPLRASFRPRLLQPLLRPPNSIFYADEDQRNPAPPPFHPHSFHNDGILIGLNSNYPHQEGLEHGLVVSEDVAGINHIPIDRSIQNNALVFTAHNWRRIFKLVMSIALGAFILILLLSSQKLFHRR
ncbi:hypothetical protein DsansV1_C02g0015401 [Dioscorea sansibarensis]